MVKLQWALVCQRVIVDSNTSSFSCIDVVESLSVSSIPNKFPPFNVVGYWFGQETQKSEVRLRLLTPSGKLVSSMDFPVEFNDGFTRVHITAGGQKIETTGYYQVMLDVRKEGSGRWKNEAANRILVQENE